MPDVELSFTRAEYTQRLEMPHQALAAAGIELLFTSHPSNLHD